MPADPAAAAGFSGYLGVAQDTGAPHAGFARYFLFSGITLELGQAALERNCVWSPLMSQIDPFASHRRGLQSPATHHLSVTPQNAVDLPV
uniref:spike base protein, RCAP_Rcc01079 family n=1 Tax=Leisingera caerulea TaxID=506591 RepID=UPI0021A85127|nr:hypothetical protein [Leisingera caerulea]